VQAIGAFLRAINALENIRSSTDFAVRAQAVPKLPAANILIKLAIADANDAVEVLNGASVHPDAAFLIIQALADFQTASITTNQATRNALLQDAIDKMELARTKIQAP
jgi:hypothetical protein